MSCHNTGHHSESIFSFLCFLPGSWFCAKSSLDSGAQAGGGWGGHFCSGWSPEVWPGFGGGRVKPGILKLKWTGAASETKKEAFLEQADTVPSRHWWSTSCFRKLSIHQDSFTPRELKVLESSPLCGCDRSFSRISTLVFQFCPLKPQRRHLLIPAFSFLFSLRTPACFNPSL